MRFDVEERKKPWGVSNIDEKNLSTLETSFSLMVQYPIHELHNLLSPWGTIEQPKGSSHHSTPGGTPLS